ncbi:hypothetical protein J4E93_005716 [Alternaria ventricosa]|uniref:uncharacterized protein n=1 Tax=Alternaria ventricosa TaxID=1187951 RepID=UPI0020C262A8|nr:uncharacterized protein J4E93_005716 [Alternaria ventricosa]KAI4644918.1 hypothetical protein J4E93_005716 [Alternaria ventricosa]
MWLERAKFVIDWHSVHAFLESFYPNEEEYGSGPKELIIQYETAFDCTLDRPTEIIHLVRLGLAFKGLEVRIIHFEDCAPAGVSITKLVQYGGCTRLGTEDTALVKEAKRKWRVAVQEYEVKSVVITMQSPDEAVDVRVKFSEQLASTTGTTGLDGLWDEIVTSELRNRIYEYAAEAPSRIIMLKPGNPPTISLTQVCRQIRDEFRKIYMQNASFTVRDKDIKRFTNAFFAPGHTNQWVLDGQRPSRVIYRYPRSTNVDILPLLEIKMSSPQTEVSVIPGPADTEEQFYSQDNCATAEITFGSWIYQQVGATLSRQDFRADMCVIELRNRIYDFAVETEANRPRCVLPCLALAQSCQQLRTEYRSICLKRDIIIDWKAVTGYMRTFFPIENGKIDNVELAPASMTIVTPWRGDAEGEDHYGLDMLSLVKIGLCRPDFTCHLVHDTAKLQLHDEHEEKHREGYNFRGWIDEDATAVERMMFNRHPRWLSDIETGSITRIMVSNIGVSTSPQAAFYLKSRQLVEDLDAEDEEFEGGTLGEAYFNRIGVDPYWGEFPEFPGLRIEV